MNKNKYIDKLKSNIRDPREMQRFFLIFYTVGILGMSIPFTFPVFLKLIPLAIIISTGILPLFHVAKDRIKPIIVFSAIYVLSFAVEAVGVNTGRIFGSYEYGDSLGIKIFGTPIIIGLNWVLLVYLSSSVLEKARMHAILKVVVASIIMLFYDVILEQLAPVLDMWHWEADVVPLQNYIAWFIIALIFNSMIKIFGIKTSNKLAWVILICQIVFFIALYLLLK